jgi:glycosyltransferase involved in cell wall biosynthesis
MDEGASLAALYEELIVALEGVSFELILVDDGSEDDSLEASLAFARADERVRILQLRRHFGKSAALAAGFVESRGRSVVALDADLQYDPADIESLLAELAEGSDLVSGWRRRRRDRWTRRLESRIFNWATRRLSGLKLHDFNCGLKAYTDACARALATACYGELHRYLPVLAHARGFRVTELPIRHRPRKNGTSRYGMERLVRSFLDLLTVSFLSRYMRRPMHAFGGIGLVFLAAGIGLTAVVLLAGSLSGASVGGGFPIFIGVALSFAGLMFLCFGLVAEVFSNDRNNLEPYFRVATPRHSDSGETPEVSDEPAASPAAVERRSG